VEQQVEFGLTSFGDVTATPDGASLTQAQVIRDVIDEAVLADQVGVDAFGIGEHHRPDFAVSAPEVVLGAIAARTQNIRVGSAVTVLSADDPVRVFQRFSTLGAIARGRAEVMLGRGAFTEPFPLFGYELSQYGTLFDEKLDLFAMLIRQDKVTWRGNTRPALTAQSVYPRLERGPLSTWLAVGATPESVLRAARYDLPMMLGIVGGDPLRFMPFVEIYKQAFEKLGRPRLPVGVHSAGYVADSDTAAREEFWAAYKPLRDRIGGERRMPPITPAQFSNEIEAGSLYVGSPETVARKIAKTLEDLGALRFDMKYSTGALTHGRLLHSIELYGSRVIPRVREMLACK
jgi:probable LLM family oxidoreductase